jgi:hypothetical protein
LISRVAERRAGDSREAARQISARNIEHDLRQAFDKRLDTQLKKMNETASIAWIMKLLLAQGPSTHLSTRSSQDCIYIGIGGEGSPGSSTATPPRSRTVAPIEIGIYSSSLTGPLAKLLTASDGKTSLQSLPQGVLRSLLIPQDEAEGIAEAGIQDGWLVFGLQNPATASTAMRRWTDASGKYHVEAAFVELSGEIVRLKKADGHPVRVELGRLSADDRQYVRLLQGKTDK